QRRAWREDRRGPHEDRPAAGLVSASLGADTLPSRGPLQMRCVHAAAILPTSRPMAIALVTNYLAPYRIPLYERLARSNEIEVLLYGGGDRYVPPWFQDLGAQLAAAPFPARRLAGAGDALAAGR